VIETTQSRFVELIGDVEAFRLMLEGALGRWEGAYDVLLADTHEYLYNAIESERFCGFCSALRAYPEGDALCREHDTEMARRARTNQSAHMLYKCHAGLTDVAVPIRVGGELVATVFFGQVLVGDTGDHDVVMRRAADLEEKLGMPKGTLTSQVDHIRTVSRAELDDKSARVKQLADWVSHLGAERLDYQKRMRTEHHQLKASEIIRVASEQLNDSTISWDQFWARTERAVDKMRVLIGAMAGMVLVPGRGARRDKHIAVVISGLPAEFQGRMYELDPLTVDEMQGLKGAVVHADPERPGAVHRSIMEWDSSFAQRVDKVFKIKLSLGEQHGVLAYFMNEDDDVAGGGFKIDNGSRIEMTMLEQFAAAIGLAFNNRRLADRRKDALNTQRVWLEKVSHQLTQAFGTVRGHASNIQEFVHELQEFYPESFGRWTPGDLKWFVDRVDDVMYSANNGARLAANLLRSAISPKSQSNVDWEYAIIGDVAALMIEIARDFQGPAQLRKIGRLNVDTDSFAPLNGRLKIITTDNLFKHAIGNLIDNAVKYSFPGTEIRVVGGINAEMAMVEVHNEGIELTSRDVERIFEYGFRSDGATARHAPGTGIGLYVAREIVETHGGTLTANPSRRGRTTGGMRHWHTTFTVLLPLLPQNAADH